MPEIFGKDVLTGAVRAKNEYLLGGVGGGGVGGMIVSREREEEKKIIH